MIKIIITISLVIITIASSIAQEEKTDKRLEVKFSQDELVELKANNLVEYEFLRFCVKNAFTIFPMPKGKENVSEIQEAIDIEDIENINFFNLGLSIEDEEWQYYPITGTDKLLVIYSRKTINEKIKNKK